jgi:hypothetical protein
MVKKHMFVVRNIISTVICVLKGINTFNRQMLSFYTSCTSNNMVHIHMAASNYPSQWSFVMRGHQRTKVIPHAP